MALRRRELLLLLLYTSPRTWHGEPALFGTTRLQKLLFLALRESALLRETCPDAYEYVPHHYGPYSPELDRDLKAYIDGGVIDDREVEIQSKHPTELTLDELTRFMPSTQKRSDRYILKGAGVEEVANVLRRIRDEGFDEKSILREFRDLHSKYDGLSLSELLKHVYATYREMTGNSKLTELLAEIDQSDRDKTDWEEEDDHDS